MAESAAHLVDGVIPRVPVRQWVLSFPIPLRILFVAHPGLLTPVLYVIHLVIAGFLLKQAGLKRATADTGAVTLIQRFGSAANLNIHLHCLVLDGVYRRTEGEPVFLPSRAPTGAELQGLLDKIIARLLKRLTRLGHLVEEEGMTYLADIDPDNPLTPLQAASCTYRIALGPRAGQKVPSLRTVPRRDEERSATVLCADAHGFSLHAGVRCGEHGYGKFEPPFSARATGLPGWEAANRAVPGEEPPCSRSFVGRCVGPSRPLSTPSERGGDDSTCAGARRNPVPGTRMLG